MLCVESDRPVDPIVVSVMHEVDAVAKEMDLPYFLVGAMARDILLEHVFRLNSRRATYDVDFAFALEGWEQFQQIKEKLILGGRFAPARHNVVHRLLFNPDGAQQRIVDLLPFGGVEQPTHIISWPPDMRIIMNVAGYGDAMKTASLVQIVTGLIIRVVSLPGLAMLKLFAWQDRGLEDSKDATDLVTLCQDYAEAGNLDRIYGDEVLALQAVDYDVELAGAWLLGKDTAATASQQTRVQLKILFSEAGTLERLVNDMAKAVRMREEPVTYAEQLLDQFIRGFTSQTVD